MKSEKNLTDDKTALNLDYHCTICGTSLIYPGRIETFRRCRCGARGRFVFPSNMAPAFMQHDINMVNTLMGPLEPLDDKGLMAVVMDQTMFHD